MIYAIAAVLVLIADQWLKYWVTVNIALDSGSITLMVGMSIADLSGIAGSITLDTPLMEAYSGVTSMNSAMSGAFPVLLPGANAISWAGNVSRVVVEPHWRYL